MIMLMCSAALVSDSREDRAAAAALQVLTEKHMLTAAEEWDLIQQLRFAPEDAWLQTLYQCVLMTLGSCQMICLYFMPMQSQSAQHQDPENRRNNCTAIMHRA